MTHKFNYKWNLSDGYPTPGITQHNKTVFTTFSCGGGSSMGYKLAGYNVIAANDIDPQMKRVYEANHHPSHYFLAPIKELINKTNFPEEFKNLDILDGSPPCSTFSMAGLRENAWGKEKHFREGQAKQILDDLFFDFIALAEKLQPKIVISENVAGMLIGHAKGYVQEIIKLFDKAGYDTQLFLLNAASMGVPQRRERVFFLSRRKDLSLPKININFKETGIPFRIYREQNVTGKGITIREKSLWDMRRIGDLDLSDIMKRKYGKDSNFTTKFIHANQVIKTLTTHADAFILFDEPRRLSDKEAILASSFPQDYNFGDLKPFYVLGMSVPPIMMAQVANQVYEQWLSKL